jgi:putative NADH-flavin reductase
MKLVIFGASGGVGRYLLDRALGEGHHVTAAVRNPATLHTAHHRLRVVRADIYEPASVSAAMAGQDVVFGTLGADSRRGPTSLYSLGARAITQGMREHGVRRLVFLSNFGVLGEEGRGVRQTALLWLARPMLRHTLADHRRALDVIGENAPQWVAVRPLPLTHSEGTGRYRVSADALPPGGVAIARADVADFMLEQATADTYLGQAPAIAY